MQGVRRIALGLIVAVCAAPARASTPAISPRAVLPEWVHSEETLHYYIGLKYFGPPQGCEPLQEDGWFCHIACGDDCRIESFFDLRGRREVTLPQTDANYFLIPKWRMLAGIAFLPSPSGWDLSLVTMRLSDLMVSSIPILSREHASVRAFKLEPKGDKVGFDIRYCIDGDCFLDAFRFKRGKLVLKSHRSVKD